MANQHTNKWTNKHEEIIVQAINNLVYQDIPFCIQELCDATGFAKTTVRQRVAKACIRLDVKLSGVQSSDTHKNVTVALHKERKDPYEYQQKKKDIGKQKFMCKCLTDVGIMWMSMSAHNKESAKKYIEEDYDIQGVLGVYTLREYSQVRLPSQRVSNRHSMTDANSVGNRAGRGGRKG